MPPLAVSAVEYATPTVPAGGAPPTEMLTDDPDVLIVIDSATVAV